MPKIIKKNRKAYFNYEIIDKIEAGVVLTGAEVKSVKNSQVDLGDAFVRIEDREAWLWNANISRYKFSSDDEYDPKRRRKLLLKKREIDSLEGKVDRSGLTLVPLSIYLSRGRVKVEVGLGRGKKQHDKKRKIKEREQKRELHRERRKYMVK